MSIQGKQVQLLLDFAAYRFMAVDILRRHLPDSGVDLCAEECRISTSIYQRILQEIIREQASEDLGVQYGMYLNLQALGLIHRISLEVNSIEQAISILSEYLRVYFPFLKLDARRSGSEIQFELSTEVEEEELRRFILDSTFCFLYRELKTMGVEEMRLQVPYSESLAFEQALEETVEMGNYHTFSFEQTIVDQAINPRSLQLIDVLLPQYLLLLDQEKEENFPAMVKRMLLQMSNPMLPTLSQVSVQFAMSDRNFQRKLRSHGRSFRSITNEVKQQLAFYLQKGGKMKVKDIAYALGYSEPSAYLHAVKNWKKP
ncbi:MAG: AraC family transcriptional regulator ligand-binding domain-containing protein [Saprospiraceae bacterium]|nr:AraC family transcriptional regulator ligand-binding domain-containing protein [Saprospiraceae bacterium]